MQWVSSGQDKKLLLNTDSVGLDGLKQHFPEEMLSHFNEGLLQLVNSTFTRESAVQYSNVLDLQQFALKNARLDVLETFISFVFRMKRGYKARTKISNQLFTEILLYLFEDHQSIVDFDVSDDGGDIVALSKKEISQLSMFLDYMFLFLSIHELYFLFREVSLCNVQK